MRQKERCPMTTGSPAAPARERRHTAVGSSGEQDRLVSIAEAAYLLGVSPSKISRMIRAGTLPSRKLGPKLLRIPVSALQPFLEPEEVETDE